MALRLGGPTPDFTAETTVGPLRFHAWKRGSWAILFSHPRDFTPVCTTELGALAKLAPEFARRNVRIIGLSVDSIHDHRRWARDIAETQNATVEFPLIGDPDRRIARLYDVIDPQANDTATVRSVFVIAPDDRIALTLAYPASTGCKFDEVLRVIDSLQLTAAHAVATPANWRAGDDVIIVPSLSEAQARERFPGGWTAHTPYLRVVPQPGR